MGYTLAIAGLLCIIYVKYYQKKEYSPYHMAHICYTKWKQNKEESCIQQLLPLLKKYPELAKKYDAMIAQTLLVQYSASESNPVLQRLMVRNQSALPTYYQLSYIAQCMLRKDFVEALEAALQLKEQARPDSYLYGLSLIQIAGIYRAMGSIQEEKEAWRTVYNFLQDIDNDPKGVKKEINKLYNQGNISFCDYLSTYCF